MGRSRDLSIKMCAVKFPNPFLLSSSPVSNTAEMVGRAFDAGWGGVAYKSVTHERTRIIHPFPRMAGYNVYNTRLAGLQNVEQTSDRPMRDNFRDIKYLKKHWPEHPVICSIMGFSEMEWDELAKWGDDTGSDMLELNFSCPHMTVEGAGMKVGQALELIERFTAIVRKRTKLPILAKLTSNVTDIAAAGVYAKKGGADGITAINTVRALTNIDLDSLVPLPNVGGKGAMSGYSGPAIKPIGLRCVTELAQYKELGLPISGCGGAETWRDVAEYILCGASTVQFTTAIIHYGYRIVEDLIEGLSDYLDEKGFPDVGSLVGRALPMIVPTDRFDLSIQGVAEYDLDRCIGCGQCHIVCRDSGGQCVAWDEKERLPVPDDTKCLGCMVCSFICPIDGLITYKEIKNKKPVVPKVSE